MFAQANKKNEIMLIINEKETIKKIKIIFTLFVSKLILFLPFIGIGTQHVNIGKSPGTLKNAEKNR
jgi:hypothetical protein